MQTLEALAIELHQPRISDAPANSSETKIRQLVRAIQAEPQRRWEGSAEARRLHLSEVHFRQQCGMPPHQWVLHCRMALAARFLQEQSEPVKIIAEKVGFSDPFHFTKTFRHHHGISPAAYRKQMQSQIPVM
jgi:AraC-like DNA-binding protein